MSLSITINSMFDLNKVRCIQCSCISRHLVKGLCTKCYELYIAQEEVACCEPICTTCQDYSRCTSTSWMYANPQCYRKEVNVNG